MYRVLVVDDEISICKGLQALIDWQSCGFGIPECAYNGVEALDLLRRAQFDVLITDIRMPGIDGIELIQKIRESRNAIRIIVLSGYRDFEYARIALENQVRKYILKPVGEDILIDALAGIRAELDDETRRKSTISKSATVIREKILQDLFESGVIPPEKATDYLENNREGSSSGIADAVSKYIRDHCSEDINIKSVSRVFYLNPAYLGRVFKNAFGISFTDHLNACRIELAASILESHGSKVSEVCKLAGYIDMSYFLAQFKSRKGMTPSEYRALFSKQS